MNKIIVLLMLIALFSACSNKPVSNNISNFQYDKANNHENDVENNATNYRIESKSIQLSISQYANTPVLCEDEILAVNPENWVLSNEAKTVVYSIETQKEKELDILSVDPKFDRNYYYYTDFGNESSNQTTIIKEDRKNREKKIIYAVKEKNHKIGVRLSLLGEYIAFYEEIYSDDLGSVQSYNLVVIDTNGNILFTNEAIPFGPFDPVRLCDKDKVIYCTSDNNRYKLNLFDLKSKKPFFCIYVSDIPLAYDFDGSLLGWSLHSGEMSLMDISTENIKTIDNNCGDIRIIDSRFIVYGKDLDVYIMDTKDNAIVYQASKDIKYSDGNNIATADDLHFIVFFQVDKENNSILVQYEDWTVGYYNILLLELKPDYINTNHIVN